MQFSILVNRITRLGTAAPAVAAVGLLASLALLIHPQAPPAAKAAEAPGAASAPASGGRLVVHEWGTFTGLAGSDGVHLPFLTRLGLDLPEFVSNRQRFAEKRDKNLAETMRFIKGGGLPALQRMETPVLYFYPDRERDVAVRVDFPKGELSEFYPPAREIGPQFGQALGEYQYKEPQTRPAGQPAPAGPKASFLDWGRVHLVPAGARQPAPPLPEIKASGGAYAFARETDSAFVETAEDEGAGRAEKFIFYRGLGNFSLPVTLAASGKDRFVLRNAGASPVHTAFLIQVDGRPDVPNRFARFTNLVGNTQMALPQAVPAGEDLGEEIVRALTAEGLFEKEARAMVATWKANWLGEPGTRVLYIVPRPVTDELLPLRVSPTPDEMVRVLVGRIDVLTPELEGRIGRLLVSLPPADPNGAKVPDGLSDEDVRTLNDLGRFLYPAIERITKRSADPAAEKQADRLEAALTARRMKAK